MIITFMYEVFEFYAQSMIEKSDMSRRSGIVEQTSSVLFPEDSYLLLRLKLSIIDD